jgi:hypothetical protein
VLAVAYTLLDAWVADAKMPQEADVPGQRTS